jgi:hypothetical protein
MLVNSSPNWFSHTPVTIFLGGKRHLLVDVAGLELPLLVGIAILGGAQDNASPL